MVNIVRELLFLELVKVNVGKSFKVELSGASGSENCCSSERNGSLHV